MVTTEIFGRVYVYCTKMELPEVIKRIKDYTMVFVVTSLNDISDMLNDFRNTVEDTEVGKFIVLRRNDFNLESANELLSKVSSEIREQIARRASYLPLLPFRYAGSKRVYTRSSYSQPLSD